MIDQELGGGILGIFGSTVEEVTLPSPRLSKVEIQCVNEHGHKLCQSCPLHAESDQHAPPFPDVTKAREHVPDIAKTFTSNIQATEI